MYRECHGVAPRGIGLRVVRVMAVPRLFKMAAGGLRDWLFSSVRHTAKRGG